GKIITHPEGHPRGLVEAFAPGWIAWLLKDGVATGVSTPEEARAEVDARADSGADAIKVVVDSIPLEADIMAEPVLRSVVDRARERGLRTVAHIGTTDDAIVAAENGAALWVHGVYKERIPDDKVAQIASYGIPMVTTSEVFDSYGRALAGPRESTDLEENMVSPEKIASFHPFPEDFDLGALESWLNLMQETRKVRLDNVGRLHAAGVTILAGSDTQSGVFPGAGLHRELVTLVAAGLTPAEALRAATLDPARYLEQTDNPQSGVIAPGKRADLVLVNGDPIQDIAAASDIREVILNGKLLERQSLN
ncbi:MAG: amidohydrolase family protein, partial [Halioglobus sp.]|nr:amidohydrolase family protein [Halioglobus sp.]